MFHLKERDKFTQETSMNIKKLCNYLNFIHYLYFKLNIL